jgi:hypothetical protein
MEPWIQSLVTSFFGTREGHSPSALGFHLLIIIQPLFNTHVVMQSHMWNNEETPSF